MNPIDALSKQALAWKQKISFQKVFHLCESDILNLTELCQANPLLAKEMETNDKVRVEFFKRVLRDHIPVNVVLQFPETVEELRRLRLQQTIGRFKSPLLFVENGKLLTLIDHAKVSIKEFLLWAKSGGKWDIFESGIHLGWDQSQISCFEKPVDSLKERWWEALPVYETVPKEVYQTRVGLQGTPNGSWIFTIAADRATPGYDLNTSHGYLEVAIPCENDYFIYPFGKLPTKKPQGTYQNVVYITNTELARIHYPDHYYSYRQIARSPRILTPEQGHLLMKLIGEKIQQGRDGNLIIQFGWDNCAMEVQRLTYKIFPAQPQNYYTTHILKAQPAKDPLKTAIAKVNQAPKWLQPLLIYLISASLGWHRGRYIWQNNQWVYRSMITSPFARTCHTNIPARLHVMIEQGRISGTLRMGYELDGAPARLHPRL
jgi:hypothetical protein